MTRTVLITGASSGFGAASARRFAADGDNLILVARRADRLAELEAELQNRCTVTTLPLDLTDADAVQAAFAGLENTPVDVLLNNAGLALGLEPAHQVAFSDWQTMVDTNITALLRVTRLLLPAMVAQNRGHIINIASTAASWPYPGGNTYGASKAFVQQFSRGLRADLLGTAIRVTTISPGMAQTEFSNVRFKQNTEKADAVYQNTQPLTAGDLADIIHWVTSVPAHVNVNELEVMPVCQAWGPLAVHRDS